MIVELLTSVMIANVAVALGPDGSIAFLEFGHGGPIPIAVGVLQ